MVSQPRSNFDDIVNNAWDMMGQITKLYEQHKLVFRAFANGYVALNQEGNLLFGKTDSEMNERIAHSRLTGKNSSRYFKQELDENGIPYWPQGLSSCP